MPGKEITDLLSTSLYLMLRVIDIQIARCIQMMLASDYRQLVNRWNPTMSGLQSPEN